MDWTGLGPPKKACPPGAGGADKRDGSKWSNKNVYERTSSEEEAEKNEEKPHSGNSDLLLPDSSEPSSPLASTPPSHPSSASSFLACTLPHLSRSEVGRNRYAPVTAANCPVIDC